MIGVGFKILTRTPVPKLPELPPPSPIAEDIKGYISLKNTILSVKSSIWIGCFFFKGRVYDWGWLQNTDLHTRTKITPVAPPIAEDIKGYISSKYTILSVKSSIWIGCFFSKAGYMIGVGSEYWLAHPYQNYPEFPFSIWNPHWKRLDSRPEFKTFSLFVYVNCVQLYSLLQVVLIMLNGWWDIT